MRQVDGPDGIVYSSRSEWGYYPNGYPVRVIPPGDPYTGRTGTVERTFADAGDIVHVVQFRADPDDYPPGPIQKGYYLADDLISAAQPPKPQPNEQDS